MSINIVAWSLAGVFVEDPTDGCLVEHVHCKDSEHAWY